MTTHETTMRRGESRLLAAGAGICIACWSALRRLARNRRDRAHLHRLPDYLLSDIGISRSEIDSVVILRGSDPSRRMRG